MEELALVANIRVMMNFHGAGRLQPDEVTAVLRVEPTSTWLAGDRIGESIRTHQEHGWSFEVGGEGDSIEPLLSRLREIFEPRTTELQGLGRRWDIELSIAVSFYGASAPVLHLDQAIVAFASAIGASVDLDVYCLGEEEPVLGGW